jgi:hypothetical protein
MHHFGSNLGLLVLVSFFGIFEDVNKMLSCADNFARLVDYGDSLHDRHFGNFGRVLVQRTKTSSVEKILKVTANCGDVLLSKLKFERS